MTELNKLNDELIRMAKRCKEILGAIQVIHEVITRYATEEAAETAPEKKRFTIEEVRAALLEKRKAGYRDEVKALLVRHGAEKLTDIDPAEYEPLMAEAEVIGT